jgi:hypothetical protein
LNHIVAYIKSLNPAAASTTTTAAPPAATAKPSPQPTGAGNQNTAKPETKGNEKGK